MSADKPVSLIARIRERFNTLHPMERRLADVLLNFPGDLASYSASDFARFAHVSNATVSRFFRKLGYPNFDAARRHIRAQRQSGAALLLLGQTDGTQDSVIEAHDRQGQTNLARTFAALSITDIDSAVQAMMQARRVWIVGFRSGHSLANYLYWQVLQVVERAVLLPVAGQTLAEYIASMEPDDMVVLFDFKRRPRMLDRMIQTIAARGADMMVISDMARVAPQSKVAWHFQCQTMAPGPLFNHTSAFALCHLIATRVIQLAASSARKRLALIETLHEDLEDF